MAAQSKDLGFEVFVFLLISLFNIINVLKSHKFYKLDQFTNLK